MRMPKGRSERLILKVVLWVAIFILGALVVLLLGSTWEVYQKEKGARAELEIASASNTDLSERKEKLTEDLADLQSERGLEEEFRKRFPVVKTGEEVIVLVDAKDEVQDSNEVKKSSFWSKIKGWFSF